MALNSKKLKVIIVLILLALGGGAYSYMHRFLETTDDAAFESTVISVSPKVSGYVTALNVSDNQIVKAGDVLVQIDPTDYQIRLDRAQAALDAAKSGFDASSQTLATTKISAPSNLEGAQAQVASAQATWENASSRLKRLQGMNDLARSRQQLEDAVADEAAARSTLNDTKAKLRSAQTAPQTVAAAQSGTNQIAALVKQAEADVAQAQTDLDNTKVTAPIDGRISNRGVEKGDFIQPGQILASLVGNDLWVVANYKETQLTNMKKGQPVKIHIDAYPKVKLTGKLDSIQSGTGARFSAFPAQNATGNFVKVVQRVPVKIILDKAPDAALAIGPGLSVVPTVNTQ